MAKGILTFEFSSALDLENQMRAYLRMPLLKEVTLGELETTASGPTFAESLRVPAPTLEPSADGGILEQRKRAAEEAVAAQAKEVADKMAAAKAAEKAGQEAEAGKASQEMNDVPPPGPAVTQPTSDPASTTPQVTLENLSDVPYPELLAWCAANKVAMVDPVKNAPMFFRTMVEMRARAFLEAR